VKIKFCENITLRKLLINQIDIENHLIIIIISVEKISNLELLKSMLNFYVLI
jgi:hypothetical protein